MWAPFLAQFSLGNLDSIILGLLREQERLGRKLLRCDFNDLKENLLWWQLLLVADPPLLSIFNNK